MRGRGGFIGANVVPAAAAANSAASGLWTVREADGFKRAGTWPTTLASEFVSKAGITDSTQIAAIKTLVNDLANAGLLSKLLAVYPFVGGSAASHKWNLVDPRDEDAAYRLAFTGTWTHSSNGATPSTANADTYLNPATVFAGGTYSLGIYLRNNPASGETYRVDIGCANQVPPADNRFFSHIVSGDGTGYFDYRSRVTVSNATYGEATGFHALSRTSSSSLKVFRNGIEKAHNTSSSNTYPIASRSVWLGANNNSDPLLLNHSNRQIAFAFLGNSLTDAEVGDMHSAVHTFQTTLSRNV
jgi:hypothetical protein